MNRYLFILCLVLTVAITSCTIHGTTEPEETGKLPTPTTHPLFDRSDKTPVFPTVETTLVATVFHTTIPEATPVITQSQIITTTIYDDALNPGWQVLENKELETDILSEAQVYGGKYAVALTPSKDFTTMYFAVNQESEVVYRQDQVISLSFWLNSGENGLALEDLAIAIVGSNDFPYWVAGDESAYIDGEAPFSETRLYFLGINNAIPSETWVEIVVTLDSLIYDPYYNYVTGFYIKNNEGFYNTIYVDNIRLTMLASETNP